MFSRSPALPARAVPDGPRWVYEGESGPDIGLSEHRDGVDSASVFAHARRMGLEGVIAKRRERPYRSRPLHDWMKVKPRDTGSDTLNGVILRGV